MLILDPYITNYTYFTCDHAKDECQGVLTYIRNDKTGRAIEELCETTNLTVLQDENSPPTQLFKVNKEEYRPDLTLVSSNLLNRHTVDVLDMKLGNGDHSPILLSIFTRKKKKFKQRTKWNFKRANWELFKEKSDQKLLSVDDSDYACIDDLCDQVNKCILEAAGRDLPKRLQKTLQTFLV